MAAMAELSFLRHSFEEEAIISSNERIFELSTASSFFCHSVSCLEILKVEEAL